MGKALDNPVRPFVAVLGGAKVSDKIGVINNLLEKADTIIIGGGMAYTFKKAQGFEIGKSLLEADRIDYAKDMIAKAEAKGVKFLLPVDNYCAAEFSADAEPVLVEGNIPENLMGMDIGPKTQEMFAAAVKGAGTIVWNGPMGVFEFDKFAVGTKAMAQALADSGAITIVGGGDSAAAVEKLGLDEERAQSFSEAVDTMNEKLRESMQLVADEIASAKAMTPELGVRLMGDLSTSLAETYDAIGACAGEDRRDQVSELQLFDFIDPSVAEPLIAVQDKVDPNSFGGSR